MTPPESPQPSTESSGEELPPTDVPILRLSLQPTLEQCIRIAGKPEGDVDAGPNQFSEQQGEVMAASLAEGDYALLDGANIFDSEVDW